MRPDEIDWHAGSVVLWSLDLLDPSLPLDEQDERLAEYMVRVKFPDGAVLDAGWQEGPPDAGTLAAFVVVVVRGPDWDEPVFRARCSDLKSLRGALAEAADHTHGTRDIF